MKRKRLPPLKALRTFEVAARLGSFAKAAEDLCVTPAAVSHQIKLLEEFVGHLLFERLPNGLSLTRHGSALLPGVTAGFDSFEDAIGLVKNTRTQASEVLVVSALPSFSQEWLIPRLVDFRAQFPEVDVLIQTEYRMVDLQAEEVDVAIRFGRLGLNAGLDAQLLANETVTPVCSPSLLPKPAGEYDKLDLIRFTLLNSTVRMVHEPWMSWDLWLQEAGLNADDLMQGPRFSDPLLILRAAIAGRGMVLGRSMLVHDHLAHGRLVAPFPDWVKPIQSSYFVVTTAGKARLHRVAVFRKWLLEYAHREQAGAAIPPVPAGAAVHPRFA
jgi:LysR family transcriptional regulator, glycine cleavage system transcriptional activator